MDQEEIDELMRKVKELEDATTDMVKTVTSVGGQLTSKIQKAVRSTTSVMKQIKEWLDATKRLSTQV